MTAQASKIMNEWYARDSSRKIQHLIVDKET